MLNLMMAGGIYKRAADKTCRINHMNQKKVIYWAFFHPYIIFIVHFAACCGFRKVVQTL